MPGAVLGSDSAADNQWPSRETYGEYRPFTDPVHFVWALVVFIVAVLVVVIIVSDRR